MAQSGIITTYAFPPGFTQEEYQRILLAGRIWKDPDGWTHDHAPIYRLSEQERSRSRATLRRYASDVQTTHNLACNAGRTIALDFLSNAPGYTGINYFAVGTGSSVMPSTGDTQLVAEYYRQAIGTVSIASNVLTFSTTFSATVANTTYTEAGLFGNGATTTANSGTLFTHATYTYNKTSSIVLTNTYDVTLT